MNKPLWTISSHVRNILRKGDFRDGVEVTQDEADDSHKRAVVEHFLVWNDHRCHVLTGERGKIILEEFAAELNAKNYVPRFEKGKIYMDLTPTQKLKLASKASPELPFA